MAGEFALRQARENDIDRVVEIALAAWWPVSRKSDWERTFGLDRGKPWQHWKALDLRSFLSRSPIRCIVAEQDGRLAGFSTWVIDTERRIGQISNNAVDPEFKGKGLSTLLYTAVLEIFRESGMEYATVHTRLDDDHLPARKAYEKIGFKPVYETVMYGLKL